MKMYNYYKYIFYKYFAWYSKNDKDINSNAEITAWGISSTLIGLNFYTLYVFICNLLTINVSITNGLIYLFSFIIAGFNFYIFIYKNKYKQIFNQFSIETIKEKNTGSNLVIFYTVLTFFLVLHAIGFWSFFLNFV